LDQYINKIENWIQSYVIGLNLCPFASFAFNEQKIYYKTELSSDPTEQLKSFWKCIELLNKSEQKTSSILILPNGLDRFDDYLDLYDKSNWILEDSMLFETYQLASFHPQYLFENEAKDSLSHYTNRSPLPIIHILSVDEVSSAIKSHGHTEKIPFNNIKKLNSMGITQIKTHLK